MRQSAMGILCSVWFVTLALPVTAAEPQLSPVITREAVCVLQWNGEESWTAYKKTASYQAFFESGLLPGLISELPQVAWQQYLALLGAEIPAGIELSDVSNILMPAWTNGGILALGGQSAEKSILPYVVLVVRGGANGYPLFKELAIKLTSGDVEEVKLFGRKFIRIDDKKQEIAVWAEGNDLVFFFGMEASDNHAIVEPLLSTAEIDQLDKQPAWLEAWSEEPIPTESFRLWMNLQQLLALGLQMAGISDKPEPLQQFFAFTGIDQLQTFAFGSGCHGNHLVHDWSLQAKQSPMQMIGWGEQTVSLDQLPPLPADVCSFSMQVVDLKRAFQCLWDLLSQLEDNPAPFVSFLQNLGMTSVQVSAVKPENQDSLKEQIEIALSALEPVVCIYNDRKQQLLPWGIPTVAVKVKEQAVLLAQLEKLGWKRDDRWGCPTFYQAANPVVAKSTVQEDSDDVDEDEDAKPDQPEAIESNIAGWLSPSLGTTTIAICDGWLVAGIQPQTVQTFVLRSQRKLPRWTLDKIAAETQTKLPAKFTRLVYDDPRASIESLASLAPWLRDGVQVLLSALGTDCKDETKPVAAAEAGGSGVVKADFKQPIASPLDIPPVELVVAPLFPNVSVTTVKGNITRERTYGSRFAQNPILLAVGGYIALTFALNVF